MQRCNSYFYYFRVLHELFGHVMSNVISSDKVNDEFREVCKE
jgi:hypothetical protein